MTKSDSVQRLYFWALDAYSNSKKTPCLSLLVARDILKACDSPASQEEKYQAVESVIKGWAKQRRVGLRGTLELLFSMMGEEQGASRIVS